MPHPLFWHRLLASRADRDPAVDPRWRLRLFSLAVLALLGIVFARVVHLEITQGAAFRAEAARPLVHQESLPGVRGRILARDGTVLAYDKETQALAVHYRYLEEPPDPQWLRSMARSRLSPQDRKNPERVSAEIARLRVERAELARGLASLCGLSADEWRERAAAISSRVEQISEKVNRRHQQRLEGETPPKTRKPRPAGSDSWLARASDFVHEFLEASMEESPPERITVAEELAYHVMVENLSLEVVAELEAHPDAYPGVRIVAQRQRVYPAGSLAAQVIGHLGDVQPEELAGPEGYHPEDRLGRMGLERRYESLLRGERGMEEELLDHSGRTVQSHRQRAPGVGRDLVLTLDPQLQRALEALLDEAIRRRELQSEQASPAGGAAIVLDARNGAILAAASAPRFDPNLFSGGPADQLDAVLHDPARPMINRVTAMAIAPGSVFKVVTAIAILESAGVSPETPFHCQGYLDQPDQWRCAIFRRQGVGHGEVTLADALAQSCNVYFLHHAAQMGPEPLIDWATRLGIGAPTGIDLPEESAGVLPTPASIEKLESHRWRRGDTLALSIGQGSLQVTPLQMARLLAAVANGGLLVTPHVVSGLALPQLTDEQTTAALDASDDPVSVRAPQPIPQLKPSTLAALREGLRRVVADPQGTAHGSLSIESLEVAGKTGTAETDTGAGDHAWFAGYAPADRPKVVCVVALEHAGNADEAAVPVAKRILLRLQQSGYFGTR